MNANGYKQYKEQSVMSMTNGELLLLLFDEISKRLTRAEIAIDAKDFNLFDQSVDRASEITMHLKDTLDRQYPISAELSRMYDFFLYEFSRVKASRKKEIIAEVKPLVKDLRETFAQAQKTV